MISNSDMKRIGLITKIVQKVLVKFQKSTKKYFYSIVIGSYKCISININCKDLVICMIWVKSNCTNGTK